ncbi:DUF1648 domain-containing protein [Nocardioides sp. Soil796]|uniref:DUF1648 domain-containing protein n=1 Tax=Nocardioides sp. Soil796 TaxID=1736412 RepID=UPI0007089D86|nr:DUF1648 domain-containing protein [Nocardioides sp. Soil796]KRF12945.1 hypothetical protein ASH02_15665 [Nocardioides sp. Soil796]
MIWFFRLSVLAYFASVALAAVRYPDEVPVHFDVNGNADAFQGRGIAVLSMAVIGLVLTGLLGLCLHHFPRASLKHINVPHKSFWLQPQNTDTLRRMLRNDLAWIGGCVMTLMTVMLLITVKVADDPQPSLGTVGVIALVVFLVAVGGHIILMYTRRYRPPRP